MNSTTQHAAEHARRAADSREKRLERVRWRCRRGKLELDIVLGRFLEQYPSLDEKQQNAFEVMLDMPDAALWDMIAGRVPAPVDGSQRELLEWLQAS